MCGCIIQGHLLFERCQVGSKDWSHPCALILQTGNHKLSGSKLFQVIHFSPTNPSECKTVQDLVSSFWTVPWPNALPSYRSYQRVQGFPPSQSWGRTFFWPYPWHHRWFCSWCLCHLTLHKSLILDLALSQRILCRVYGGSLLINICFPVHLTFLI